MLRGIRSQAPDGIGEIATSAADMHSKVAAHWAPVFCAPDVVQSDVDALVDRWMPRWRYSMPAPGVEEFASALSHGRRSAPGPDGLSYDAWRSDVESSAKTVFLLHEFLADGGVPPPALNVAWLAQ